MFDQRLHTRLDSLEHRLGIDTGEHDDRDEHSEQESLSTGEFLERGVGLVGLTVEDPLVRPEQIQRREDDANGRDDNPPTSRLERADQDEEFTHEAVQPWEANGRQHHDREEASKDRGDSLDALQLCDCTGVSTLVDHPNHQEQCTRRDAVVDVLHHTTGDRLIGESESTEDDESKVGNGRVRNESLEVLLHRCGDCAVDDADHREGVHHRTSPHRGLWEEVDAEAQHAVGAHLQEHAGENDRTASRRLGVCIGQPRMQREQRHLHREGDHEGDEQPTAGGDPEVRLLSNFNEIESERSDVATCDECGGDDADEHEGGSRHRVQEELRCGIHTLVITPVADQEVHRDENDLKEEEEQEQIKAQEAAHHTGLEEQQPGKIRLLVMMRVDADDHEREQDSREDDEEE